MIKLCNWIREQRFIQKSIYIYIRSHYLRIWKLYQTPIFIKSFEFYLECFGVWCSVFGRSFEKAFSQKKNTHAFSIQLVNSYDEQKRHRCFSLPLLVQAEQIYFKFFVSLDFQWIYINIFMQWKITKIRKKNMEKIFPPHCIHIHI